MTTTTTPTFKRVWMITGASRGIGASITAAALAHGDAVVATARNAAAITERFGRIDVLVNNAGYGLLGAVEEASADEVRRLYETNVFGLLNVTRAVLPQMRERRAGHVINISSLGGYRSVAGFGVYCSTKFAVEGLTEALHAELAPLGIHATVVEPGYFRTEFLEGQSLVTSPRVLDDYAASAGRLREAAKQISLNQPGDPERLAQAMLTLVEASDPPLRLPLGTDTLQALADKHAFVERETAQWRDVVASTDFPKLQAA
ncbi:MAG: SDR family NAD(P)-dependent oxidoreductase [Burkholderiales bacterium]|jgi:NAD(P)-dependent dehydrogenase (short-subunit alcohol dehydrogenase family)|nr:SDR family NAD(P)-dependent oxidoreductase [Burkholderiales bacterium]